jgi:hypothetical protein
MQDTATIITSHEECERKSFLSQRWEKNKLPAAPILDMGIREGLTYAGEDFGIEAGSAVYEFGATRGVDSKLYDVHSEIVHIASMADIITVAARKQGDKPWKTPDLLQDWQPSCYISPDGQYLRRIVAVPNWSDERHDAICRSWATLGSIAFYNLPMQIAVAITGNRRDGRYHSFWSHALQHPQNKKLRFRKKNDLANPFKSSWLETWRPDHDEISTKDWLDAMIEDDVLRDVFFKVDMPAMDEPSRKRVMDVAKRKMERITSTKTLPDENYASCSFPVRCPFMGCCNRGETPSEKYGFIPLSSLCQR